MKIEVNVDKLKNLDKELFFSSKKEIYEKMNKMDDFCCLVSGYRGVGKTTLVKSIEGDFMNEKGEDLNIFIYQNLDKYESYSLLLRKLIRELFLKISSEKKFKQFKEDYSDLYKKIGNLHENSFFEIHNKTSIDTYFETQKSTSFSTTLKRLIELGIPVLAMFLAAINWKTGFLIKDTGAIGVILSFIWFVTSSIDIGYSVLSKKTNSSQVEKTLLYDDEIAEYHLKNLLKELKEAKVRVFFVFDEIDKIDDPTKLLKMLSDLKHLLLMDYSSSIVIAGQDLFYEYVLSGIKDDGLISNIFSLVIHVPLLKEEVLNKIPSYYFSESEKKEEIIVKRHYFDSLIINTRKVARNMNNLIVSEIEWQDDTTYIEVTNEKLKEYKNDSKILTVIKKIERDIIIKIGSEPALFDLLDYHLFLWVKKMKLSRNYSFIEEDIFSMNDKDIKKYPYWYRERLLFIFKILIERMETARLIEPINADRENVLAYRLIFSDDSKSSNFYQELTIDFFKEFIVFEQVIRQFQTDFSFSKNEKFNTKRTVISLYKKEVISQSMYKNIVEIISIRNKVAHGKSLSSLELDKISDISFGSLITSVYEEYSNYLINRLINLSNGESHLLPMSEKKDVDFIMKREENSDILFKLKVVDQFKSSVGRNNYWNKIIDNYTQVVKNNSILFVLVYFKENDSNKKEYLNPYLASDKLLTENNVYVVYIPQINTKYLCEIILNIIDRY